MEETTGMLDKIRHHNNVAIALNENCRIPLPFEAVRILRQPHRLSYYYFQYIERGSAIFKTDMHDFTVNGGGMAFGFPNQVFTKLPYDESNQQYALSFDDSTLSLLPGSYPFLINPYDVNSMIFDTASQQRVKNLHAGLFQLLHSFGKQPKADVILAHLHTLLIEFNTAYFDQYGCSEAHSNNTRLSKFIAFKMAVEQDLTEQYDVKSIAQKLALTSSTLYGIVKEFGGVSPKEWIINRLMIEAQRKLRYEQLSVKELAYQLGFNDPAYFTRLFKKNTGKSVSRYLDDLSCN